MTTARSSLTAGRAVGILYIIGTLAGISSVVALAPFSSADNLLETVADSSTGLSFGVLAILTMGLALAMIPVVAYPVLRPHSATLARGYIVFRSGLETVAYMMTAVGWLLLIPMSALSTDGTALADGLLASEGAGIVTTIVFIIGAAMFYTILWRARLVPRWLSGWGLVAIVPYIVAAFLELFGVTDALSSTTVALDIPLAIQEMTLAVYLIVKGFSVTSADRKKVKKV